MQLAIDIEFKFWKKLIEQMKHYRAKHTALALQVLICTVCRKV